MATQYGLTDKGPNIKRLDVILDEMQEHIVLRTGRNIKQNKQSFLNHELTNVSDKIAELWEFGQELYGAMYPTSATGISLDNSCEYGGVPRETAAKSYYKILCTGTDGTTIPEGTLIASDTNPAINLSLPSEAQITRAAFNKAEVILASPSAISALSVALNGTLYTVTPDTAKTTAENLAALAEAITDEDFTVTAEEEVLTIEAVDETSANVMVLSENLTTQTVGSVITFATVDDGDIVIPNGVITKIVKTVAGLDSVVNVGDYIAGQLIETDEEYRKSYTNKIYNRSSAMLESIRSAILQNVQGVLSVADYENYTDVTDDAGRPPHSIEVVVDGGDATEIAQQILNKKAGGIQTYGNVSVTLYGVYGEEIPIHFNRPTYVKVWFKVGVTLSTTTNPPTNYAELLEEQIIAKMDALEAGDSVIPQTFNLQVSGVDYIDVWLFATTDAGTMPTAYDKRVVSVSARERAVTDADRIEVVIDG